MDSGNQPGDVPLILTKKLKLLKTVDRMFMKYIKVIIRDSVFYSSTFLGPFGGPRNSIFELSLETQSLEIALVE